MAKIIFIPAFLLISFLAFSSGNENVTADGASATASSSLHGVVLDEETGEPVIGAKVEILDEGGKLTMTDFDGAFDIENLRPGTYSLAVSFVSYEEKRLVDFEFKAGFNQVIIQLKP